MAYKKSNPNGQAAMAASEPVVIASDQSAVPVSGTVTANIGTVATLATAAKQDTGNTSVASIDTKTPALGQALAAASVPVILPSATITTLTPPAAITGFATSAKQDTLLTELQLKADLTETQPVSLTPHTTGGLSTAMFSGSDGSSILVATAQVVKASAGQLYGYYAYNPEAAVTFVHFYNTAAASVTVGTTSPLFTIAIPAGSAANLTIPQGITFSNAGWAVAATTTAGGNTAPTTGVSLVVWYM